MSKKIKINISQPCHENWQNMTPNGQGRFCGSCRKTVVDFSMMSEKELLDYFSNVSGYNACGRFSTDQLNRTIKVAANKKRFSWAYVWNIVLATFLVTEANAQVNPKKKKAAVEQRNPLHRTGSAKQKSYMPSIVSINKPDSADVSISTLGYKAKTMNWNDISVNKHAEVDLLMPLVGRVGGYTIVRKIPIRVRVNRAIYNILPSSLKKDIVVYPNPVQAGNYVRVKLNLPKESLYKLEVMSIAGQVMHVENLYLATNEYLLELPTAESWSAGVYWIRITSGETKKGYQSKLIVEN